MATSDDKDHPSHSQGLVEVNNDPLMKAVESLSHDSVTVSSPEMTKIEDTATLQLVAAVPSTDNTTLQSLLSNVQTTSAQLVSPSGQPETIEIITVNNQNDQQVLIDDNKQVWQLIPAIGNQQAIIVTEANSQQGGQDDQRGDGLTGLQYVTSEALSGQAILPIQPNLPENCPAWAARLRDCEVIGTSYRGWVESEVELDLLLTFHKQQTHSFWGTRQSPCSSKPATRLMWRSQYVPFDGVPFVNSGSRAVVMECQYGPRRKGSQIKRDGHLLATEFKQTCPARIYVKKVRKIPEYSVPLNFNKKSMKFTMDRIFQELKQRGFDGLGQERYYVQLPTEAAHENHGDEPSNKSFLVEVPKEIEASSSSRVDPQVAAKIRELVAGGETRLYAIRKRLRRFVEKEIFDGSDDVPERHNLCYFPTVHDIQNHIHQALKDIESGILPVTAPTVNVEVITSSDPQESLVDGMVWPVSVPLEATPQTETVTVTLTQNPGEDGQHVISKVETHLSDGSSQVSHTISPETAQLLSKLHPHMFPAGSLIKVQQPPTSLPSIQFSVDDTADSSFQIVPVGSHLVNEDTSTISVTEIQGSEPAHQPTLDAHDDDDDGLQ